MRLMPTSRQPGERDTQTHIFLPLSSLSSLSLQQVCEVWYEAAEHTLQLGVLPAQLLHAPDDLGLGVCVLLQRLETRGDRLSVVVRKGGSKEGDRVIRRQA